MNERVRVPPGERRGRRALPYRYLSKIFVQTESSFAPKKEARELIEGFRSHSVVIFAVHFAVH